MNAEKSWFREWFSKNAFSKDRLSHDRRRARRRPAPGLVAYYWEGGAPVAHPIRDISSTGLYMVTEQQWYPGTVVIMTLQRAGSAKEVVGRSIAVQSKVVRLGADGAGVAFVPPQAAQGQSGESNVADRKTLDRFLERFWAEGSSEIGGERRQ